MASKIRETVAPGIYRLESGAYHVKVAIGARTRGGQQRECTFPADAYLRDMKAWQTNTRSALLREGLVPAKGTLEGDVQPYLNRVQGRLSREGKTPKHEIEAWLPRFGQRRHTIKKEEIRQQVKDWLAENVAASTIRKRLTALSGVYQELDGEDARNPVDGVARPAEPKPKPGGRSLAVVNAVLDALIARVVENNHGWATLARIRLIAMTGMRHSQVMRLAADDFRLDHEPPFIMINDPGKDGEPHVKPLTPEGADAARLFIRVGCFGEFSASAMYKSWKLACKDAEVPFFNPYQLRHTYATTLRAEGMDLADVQTLLGHKSAKTTARYAGVAPHKIAAAAELLNRAWSRARGPSAWAAAQSTDKKAASET